MDWDEARFLVKGNRSIAKKGKKKKSRNSK